ncbi:MAG: glycosyltransferase [Methylobacter sp.]|nr:glycosyltransferase [Methylobacter sp.]
MDNSSLPKLALRKFFSLPACRSWLKKNWRRLRFYPSLMPTDVLFSYWNQSEWPDYQDWLNRHSMRSIEAWTQCHREGLAWKTPVKISLVTPVYNTHSPLLYECILSVKLQTYPYWQLVLVDDGSSNSDTLKLLASAFCQDPRIDVIYGQGSRGISAATNQGIDHANGDYVIFLDHDDRLALDALHHIADQVKQNPALDILYSDRDMISPQNKRFMHLFKPDWSPETLLSGNYLFHLMCYRRRLLEQLGGLRSEFDGSQDYDLILRAAETNPVVKHIDKVLYHWRQHEASVSLNDHAKDYAFEAGIAVLNAALLRRNLNASAVEISDLWRGMHRVKWKPIADCDINYITVDINTPDNYSKDVYRQLQDKPYIAILGQTVTPLADDALQALASWLSIEGVGLVCGKLINMQGDIDYIGMNYRADGSLCIPYQGFPVSEAGYMAITRIVRNISAPHPYCVVIDQELWQQLGGFNPVFQGPHALLDFALRALNSGWRCVVDPQYCFQIEEDWLTDWPEGEKEQFASIWENWLENGDPYFNKNLDNTSSDMRLKNQRLFSAKY